MKNKDSEASNAAMTLRNKNQIRNLKRRQWLIDAGHKVMKVIDFKFEATPVETPYPGYNALYSRV